MGEELKPCPFCGKPASVRKARLLNMYGIAHESPECLLDGGGEFVWDTAPEAIAAWNTRA